MPQVIVPCNGCPKGDRNFQWDMTIGGLVFYTSSIVVVGPTAFSETLYPGGTPAMKVPLQNVYTDNGVHHPGGNAVCYTRPKYSKSAGGGQPFYTINSLTTSFISTAAV